ncbi:MAG: S1C family serine protease [Lachnospiraceae bacterium]|nr:S1C family serine protease [Lachnospiraceae bacterium]
MNRERFTRIAIFFQAGAALMGGCAGTGQRMEYGTSEAQTTVSQTEQTDAILASETYETAKNSAGGVTCDIEKLAASVVRLEVYEDDGDRLGTGSGFAVGDPAVLVTAEHVIVNMDYMIAWRDDGTSFRVDQVINVNDDADVAICLLPEDAALTALTVAASSPCRGDDCLVIASQFGLTNLVTTGNVCGWWNTSKADWLLFSAPVSGGSSGGPLFNEAGEVIGMVTGTYEKAQNLNLAAPIETIKELY